MKKGMILVFLIYSFIIVGTSHAEDIVIAGKIIEGSPGEKLIQVGNKNFIVEMVLVDIGSGIPVLGSFTDLKAGRFVQLHLKDNASGQFQKAEKAVVYLGTGKPSWVPDD
jgi:hypothetical protein